MRSRRARLDALAGPGRRRPARPRRFLAALGAAAVVAYLPLTLAYGPFDWFEHGLFSFQASRPLLYARLFLAGAAVGAAGLGDGLLAPDGALPATLAPARPSCRRRCCFSGWG